MTEDGKPVGDSNTPQGGTPHEGAEPPTTPQESADDEATRQGQIRYQDADSTAPREPTMAERRARERAEQRREEADEAERAAAARKSDKRRKIMVSSGVTVGVVALVAAFYSGTSYSQDKNASTQYCASDPNGQTTSAQDQNCNEDYVNQNGGSVNHSTGMFFMPMFIPGQGQVMQPYRYGYTSGGAAPPPVGSKVSSPNFSKPTDSNVKSKSGNTVSRGGFGFGKSGGGS